MIMKRKKMKSNIMKLNVIMPLLCCQNSVLFIANMYIAVTSLLANTICSDWENHGRALIENLSLADTHNNGNIFPRLWCNFSVADISEIYLKH